MLVPEPEDLNIRSQLAVDFLGRYSQLYDNFSPILPLHFDKSFLPKNICERQFLDLTQCTLFKSHDQQSSCSYYIARFEQCRKKRDIKILQGIKQWQNEHIRSLDKQNRQMYLQGLTFKLQRLKSQYEKLPSTQAKQLKLARIQNQIQQIKWRMKNINNTIKLINSQQSTKK